MSTPLQELPSDVRHEIESPPVEFAELGNYNGEPGLYELDTRRETGYKVVLLYKLGREATLFTRVERKGKVIAEIDTPTDRGLDILHHTFPNIEPEIAELVIPKAE